jgi:hypothetical protein
MGRLVHTGLCSSSLVAHVLPYPPPPHVNSFVLGPAVINTHTPSPSAISSFALACFATQTRTSARDPVVSARGVRSELAEGGTSAPFGRRGGFSAAANRRVSSVFRTYPRVYRVENCIPAPQPGREVHSRPKIGLFGSHFVAHLTSPILNLCTRPFNPSAPRASRRRHHAACTATH